MPARITVEKLNHFDFGGFFTKDVGNDDDWSLISEKLQNIHFITNRLCAYQYTHSVLSELEALADEESFAILVQKIPFYRYFQEIRQILLTIEPLVSSASDADWEGQPNAPSFLEELEDNTERLQYCDFAVLETLKLSFAPTGNFQELAISNGWGNYYITIADTFDQLYQKLVAFR